MKKSSPAKVEEEIKEVVQDYNSGVLRVPLVQLICVNYDHGLVTSLRNAPKITLGKRSRPKGKSTVGRPQGTKRARTQRMDSSEPLIEIHEESSQPEKRKSARKVKLVARPDYEGPRSGDELGESSASDPDEYENSENE